MKNRRKGFAVMFVVFTLLLTGIFDLNKVQAEETGITVHFYNTLGWENVYVYSWSENTNADKLTLMTASASQNWYEFTFSKDMGNSFEFLFYNGEWQNYNQTENLTMSAETDTFYVVQPELNVGEFSSAALIKTYKDEAAAEAAGYPVYIPEENKQEEPVKTDRKPFTVYFKNTLNWTKSGINAWGDNAASMQQMTELSDGWFSYVFETPVSNIYNFMFYDVEAFAAETYGAGYQTGDIKEFKAETDTIWVIPSDSGDVSNGLMTVGEAGWPGVKDVDPASNEAIKPTKIYYYNTEKWEQIYIWAWTMKYTDQLSTNIWPGDLMTDLGDGWFSYELKAEEAFGLLFNNGESGAGNQTADCTDLINGKTYWLTTGDEDVLNENGIGGGTAITAFMEAKAGWPEGPKAELTQEPADTAKPTAMEPSNAPDNVDVDGNNINQEAKGNQTWIWILVIVAVCGLLAASAFVLKKKK